MNTFQVKQSEYQRQRPKNRLLVRGGEIVCPWLEAATYVEADWRDAQQAARSELDAIADGVVAYHSGEMPTDEWNEAKQDGWMMALKLSAFAMDCEEEEIRE